MPDTNTPHTTDDTGYVVGFHPHGGDGWTVEFTGKTLTAEAAHIERDAAQADAPEVCWHILKLTIADDENTQPDCCPDCGATGGGHSRVRHPQGAGGSTIPCPRIANPEEADRV